MQIYPRGGVYWCKFKHRGQPWRESTHVRVEGKGAYAKALQEARVVRSKRILREGPGGRATNQVTLAAIEQLHIESLENKGFGEVRVDTVENLHRNLQRHLGEHRDVMTLRLSDIADYEGRRRKEGARGQTIRRERQALRRGLKLAKRDGHIERMPFDWDDLEPIPGDPKKVSQTAKLRDINVIERVLAKLSVKAHTAGHVHICRYVMMTGLRSGELARAAAFVVRKLGRGQGAPALLEVPDDGSKTSDPRVIPLSPAALKIHEEWSHRFATVDVAHALKRASNLAGVNPGLTLRDLRKFYVSHAARSDLPAAQKLAGHRKVSTTALYVDADLGRAVRAGVSVTRLARGHSKGAQQRVGSKKRSDIKGARSSGG
jgi:integrase